MLSHSYYSLHLEILAFISGLSYHENFTPLSLKCITLMWPKSGVMCLSFAMRETYLRQLLDQEVEHMWRRTALNPQPRAKSRSLEGTHLDQLELRYPAA